MNMLLVVCGETAVLVDAGVMFPEPELFGVDLVIPDLSVLDAYRGRIKALVLTHGHEDHIGAIAHVIERIDGPVFGYAVHARAGRTQTRGARHRRRRPPRGGRAAAARGGRPVHARVPARDAQHAGLPGGGHPHARPASSCTPATSRSIRRRSTASTATCTGWPNWDRPACWRCSPTAPTRTAAASPDPNATSSRASRKSSAARPARSS